MSEANCNLLTDLQAAVVDRLQRDRYFIDLPIMGEDKGDLVDAIEKSINEIGLNILVTTPEVTPGQWHNEIVVKIAIGITENVIVNRAEAGPQKPAVDVGLQVMRLLKDWSPFEFWTDFKWLGQQPVEVDPNLIYEAVFETRTILHTNNPTESE